MKSIFSSYHFFPKIDIHFMSGQQLVLAVCTARSPAGVRRERKERQAKSRPEDITYSAEISVPCKVPQKKANSIYMCVYVTGVKLDSKRRFKRYFSQSMK